MSEKIVYAQTAVTESELADLKEITGQKDTKEALRDAVEYRIMHAPNPAAKKIKKEAVHGTN